MFAFKYLEELGYERTYERWNVNEDDSETDMEVHKSDGTFEEKIFAAYPLIGSKILKEETLNELNENVRGYIDKVLNNSEVSLDPCAEMKITIAVINYAKNWQPECDFWEYILLQFGYRYRRGDKVERLLQKSLENSLKKNNRWFIENANGRELKATVVTHALTPKRSWMTLFDFLFDFYKDNLNWKIIQGDTLIRTMIYALRQKFGGDVEGEVSVSVSSKAYKFLEGIRRLVLYRPAFTEKLFERLLMKIDSLVKNENRAATTYEEKLCEEWFQNKIGQISASQKA